MWRVDVQHTCIGSGSCQGISPRHFVLGEDHRARPVEPVTEPDELVLDAMASCPVEAISVTDIETGEEVLP